MTTYDPIVASFLITLDKLDLANLVNITNYITPIHVLGNYDVVEVGGRTSWEFD